MKPETESDNTAGRGCCNSDLFEDYSLESLCAEIYQGNDWHRLSELERVLVARLEKTGHLTINRPANGFVGKATTIPCRTAGAVAPSANCSRFRILLRDEIIREGDEILQGDGETWATTFERPLIIGYEAGGYNAIRRPISSENATAHGTRENNED